MDEIYRLKRWDETENGYVDFLPFYPDDDNEANNIQSSQGLIPSVGRVLKNTNNITALNNKVDKNIDDIATNTESINTNTNSINDLTTKVNTNTNNIQTNTTNIDNLDKQINGDTTSENPGLVSQVDTNTNNIQANTTNIDNLDKQINGDTTSENPGLISQIDTNTNSINDLTTKVNTNTNNIQANTTNIDNLDKQINGDTTSENPGLISQIDTNTNSINDLTTKVNTNTNGIKDLTTKVDTNTNSIKDLTAKKISSVKIGDSTDSGGILTLTSYENGNNVAITSINVEEDENKICTITPSTSKIKVTGCSGSTLGLTRPDGNTLDLETESSIMRINPSICDIYRTKESKKNYLYLGGKDLLGVWDQIRLKAKTNSLSLGEYNIKTTFPVQMHSAYFIMHTYNGTASVTGVGIGDEGKCVPLTSVRSTSNFSDPANSEGLFTLKRSWNSTETTAKYRGVQVNYPGYYLISARGYVKNLTAGQDATLNLQVWKAATGKLETLGSAFRTQNRTTATTAWMTLPSALFELDEGDRVGIRIGTYGNTGLIPLPTDDEEAAQNSLTITCYHINKEAVIVSPLT